jgi:hypothetical protein
MQGGQSGLVQPTYDNYALAVHWYNQGSFTGMKTEEAFKLWFDMTETWNAPIFVGEFGVEPKAPAYGEAPVRTLTSFGYHHEVVEYGSRVRVCHVMRMLTGGMVAVTSERFRVGVC